MDDLSDGADSPHAAGGLAAPVSAYFRQRRKQDEWRRQVDAAHLLTVRQREAVSDAELIAKAPGFPGPGYEMEMNRRLKVAITDLAGEVVASRRSADRLATRVVWLTVLLVALTAVLVALTVVLAVRR